MQEQKHKTLLYRVYPKDLLLQKVFALHRYCNSLNHIYLYSLLFVILLYYLGVLLLIFYLLLQEHDELRTKLFLLLENLRIRTALVNSILAYVLQFLWDVVVLQSSLKCFLQKQESDKVLLKYYLHFHQKGTLLQYLVFHQVLLAFRDFVKLFLNDILSVRDSIELFCQAL